MESYGILGTDAEAIVAQRDVWADKSYRLECLRLAAQTTQHTQHEVVIRAAEAFMAFVEGKDTADRSAN